MQASLMAHGWVAVDESEKAGRQQCNNLKALLLRVFFKQSTLCRMIITNYFDISSARTWDCIVWRGEGQQQQNERGWSNAH